MSRSFVQWSQQIYLKDYFYLKRADPFYQLLVMKEIQTFIVHILLLWYTQVNHFMVQSKWLIQGIDLICLFLIRRQWITYLHISSCTVAIKPGSSVVFRVQYYASISEKADLNLPYFLETKLWDKKRCISIQNLFLHWFSMKLKLHVNYSNLFNFWNKKRQISRWYFQSLVMIFFEMFWLCFFEVPS